MEPSTRSLPTRGRPRRDRQWPPRAQPLAAPRSWVRSGSLRCSSGIALILGEASRLFVLGVRRSVPVSVLVMRAVGSISVAIGLSSLERRRKPSRSRKCKSQAHRVSPAPAHLRRCLELGGELCDATVDDGPHSLFSHPGTRIPGAAHSSRSTARRELNRSQQQLVAARTTHSHISTTLPRARQGPRTAQGRTVDHFA